MQADLASEGDNHEQLLVRARDEFRGRTEPLRPCFLADGASAVRRGFVEREEPWEVDLCVENVLEGWCYVVAVVVAIVAVGVRVRV